MSSAVAIFGGTFDPPHFGHLRAASEAAEKLAVEDFRLVPAGRPPHRQGSWASPEDRLEMLRAAVRPWSDLQVDDREIHRPGPSYMVDTLDSIRREVGESPILLALGQDAANQLHRWHEWHRLIDLAHLVIMTRPHSRPRYSGALADLVAQRRTRSKAALFKQPAGLVCRIEVTRLAISSTDIRRQIANGGNPRFLLPQSVVGYIRERGLYEERPGQDE